MAHLQKCKQFFLNIQYLFPRSFIGNCGTSTTSWKVPSANWEWTLSRWWEEVLRGE